MNRVAVDQCRIRSNREKRGIVTPLRRSSSRSLPTIAKKTPMANTTPARSHGAAPAIGPLRIWRQFCPLFWIRTLCPSEAEVVVPAAPSRTSRQKLARGLMPEEGASESQTAAPVQPTISHAAAKMAMLRFRYRFMPMLLVQIDGRRSLRGLKIRAGQARGGQRSAWPIRSR